MKAIPAATLQRAWAQRPCVAVGERWRRSRRCCVAALGLAGYPYYQRYVVGVPAAINSGELQSLRTAQQRQNDELARLTAQTTALDDAWASSRIRVRPRQGPAAEPLVVPSAMPERALRVAEATFLIPARR